MSDQLLDYFTSGLEPARKDSIGMEVETSFVSWSMSGHPTFNRPERAITLEESQTMFRAMTGLGWEVVSEGDGFIAELRNARGDRLLYELGRQNLEISAVPDTHRKTTLQARLALQDLYEASRTVRAHARFEPVLKTKDDLLAVPDERDSGWVQLDGREALKPLATISSVQFTIEVPPEKAIACLNRLGDAMPAFIEMYEQERIWRTYIKESKAGYDPSRYGGPRYFDSFEDYCRKLAAHAVVSIPDGRLIRQSPIEDVPLFVRSVWWYFRLRRHGDRLCIEIRPLSRGKDSSFERVLKMVLDVLNL